MTDNAPTSHAPYDSKSLGHFRSAQGEQAYKQSYAAAMKSLPAPQQTYDVPTDFGTVRVYHFFNDKNKGLTPIVLFPGRTSGVPMWSQNLAQLAGQRPVYALDSLGDAGMSVQTQKIKNTHDQATWLDQTFEYLNLPKAHIVGHSFGGWLATNYAVHHPERLQTLSVLEPVFVFIGIRWIIYLKTLPASLTFLPKSWRDKMLADFGGATEIDETNPVVRMISDATTHFAMKLPVPRKITHQQLEALPMPVFAALAAKSALHNGTAAAAAAKAHLKHGRVKLWPDGTHSLPMEYSDLLDQELLDFMATSD